MLLVGLIGISFVSEIYHVVHGQFFIRLSLSEI